MIDRPTTSLVREALAINKFRHFHSTQTTDVIIQIVIRAFFFFFFLFLFIFCIAPVIVWDVNPGMNSLEN